MTTRITLSILLTTWVILIVGEAAAFFTARQSLIALLDDTLITRAAHVLETSVTPAALQGAGPMIPSGDEFTIRDEQSAATVASRTADSVGPSFRPTLIYRGFRTRADGTNERAITLRTLAVRDGHRVPVTITYGRPSERFDLLLSQLAFMLIMISLACGLTTAWLALKLSRAALRPVRETAEEIAQIDERNLSRRIDAAALPVELVPMAHRLNEMLERLEGVFRQRKQFLADAAHELRTPTAALLTTLEVSLRRPRDQAALMEAMHSGLADARRLRKLVEQLMEHARGEHVRADAIEPGDLVPLLRECAEIVSPLATDKGVGLVQELPESMGFATQRDRVRSVVLNLLSNAIEYNRPGGSVRLEANRLDDDAGGVRIAVSDTGQGISPEQLPHVFEPFYRGGNGGRGDDPSHLGLGLFLVKSHVQALGGRCTVESRLGEGTTIVVVLPEPKLSGGRIIPPAPTPPAAVAAVAQP